MRVAGSPGRRSDSTFGKFIQLVALRDRLDEMPGIDHWFLRFQDEAAGRVRLKVCSPEQLSTEASDSIIRTFSKVAGKEILAETTLDPSLLGGAVVELEGRVFDGSIKTKLARMAARMAGIPLIVQEPDGTIARKVIRP